MGKKLYRVYLTLYDREEFRRLVQALCRLFPKVEVHESKLVPEFKFLEVYEEKDELEERIKEEIFRSIGRYDVSVRIDRISI